MYQEYSDHSEYSEERSEYSSDDEVKKTKHKEKEEVEYVAKDCILLPSIQAPWANFKNDVKKSLLKEMFEKERIEKEKKDVKKYHINGVFKKDKPEKKEKREIAEKNENTEKYNIFNYDEDIKQIVTSYVETDIFNESDSAKEEREKRKNQTKENIVNKTNMSILNKSIKNNYDLLLDDDLKILGIRKLVLRQPVEVSNKLAPWANFKNVIEPEKKEEDVKKKEEKKENIQDRNIGFSILSNKDQVSNHLKKTKFCKIMIDYGKCERKVCDFAHSLSEFCIADCAFKEECTKPGCSFKHPWETSDEYKKRTCFKVPKNIKP